MIPERTDTRSAVEALKEAWKLGGLDLPAIPELPVANEVHLVARILPR